LESDFKKDLKIEFLLLATYVCQGIIRFWLLKLILYCLKLKLNEDEEYVQSQLSNKMSDRWLNDRLVTYIEIYVLRAISNDVILPHFQQIENIVFFCNFGCYNYFNIIYY